MVIRAGCAECGGDEPLIEVEPTIYATVEEAKAGAAVPPNPYYPNREWESHPQGGLIWTTGEGATWIMPLDRLA